jgi:ABC-2 type transport system ATP-binding protein
MAAIEVNGLTKYHGETRGVEELTFTVREGEAFCVLGPNGAGKTTAIRTLMGFQSPTHGGATVLGHNITSGRDVVKMKRKVGYVPSDPAFERNITGQKLLSYHASLKSDERSEELIEVFDLPTDRPINDYSRCETQKLAIVLAFMHDPALAVLDEPVAGLDPVTQERFYEFLRAEKQQGTTMVFSSHRLSEACQVGDRVGVLRNGHLIEIEDAEALTDHDCRSVRVRVAESVNADDFAHDGIHAIEITGASEQDDPNTACAQSVQTNGNESETSGAIHKTTVQFIYTGEYNALLEHLLEYTVIDMDITEAPLEAAFARFYGVRLGGNDTDDRHLGMTPADIQRGRDTGSDDDV